MKVGEKITKFRKMLDLNEEALSRYLGITPKELTDIESGKADTSLDVATKLSCLLGIDRQRLLQDGDYECRISCFVDSGRLDADALRAVADIHRIAMNEDGMVRLSG